MSLIEKIAHHERAKHVAERETWGCGFLAAHVIAWHAACERRLSRELNEILINRPLVNIWEG